MPDPETATQREDATFFFVSEFENKLDDKRRIQIPSAWRRGRDGGLRFLLLPIPKRMWRPGCVMGVTPERFQDMVSELRQMKVMDERADSLRRLLSTRTYAVETDSAGRVVIPDVLVTATDLKEKTVLAGMFDWFEIWNPERFAQLKLGDEDRAPEAYEMLSPAFPL